VCEITKQTFGEDSDEYRNCVLSNCAASTQCAECQPLYAQDPLSSEYRECLVRNCIVGSEPLCLQCCIIDKEAQPAEYIHCVKTYCEGLILPKQPCTEEDLSRAIIPDYSAFIPHPSEQLDKNLLLCDRFLTPELVPQLANSGVSVISAGQPKVISGDDYLEDRFTYNNLTFIRRSRVVADADILAYLGEAYVSTLTQPELDALILTLRNQLTEIRLSILNGNVESLVMDSGLVTKCKYQSTCHNTFYTITSSENCTFITNNLTGEVTQNCYAPATIFLQHDLCSPAKLNEIDKKQVSKLIEEDKSLRDFLYDFGYMDSYTDFNSQRAIDFVLYQIICPFPEIVDVFIFVSVNKSDIKLTLNHVFGTNLLEIVKPTSKEILVTNRATIVPQLPLVSDSFVGTSLLVPTPITSTPFKDSCKVENEFASILFPCNILSPTITYDTTDRVNKYLAEVDRVFKFYSSAYIKSLSVNFTIPKDQIAAIALVSETHDFKEKLKETLLQVSPFFSFNFVPQTIIQSESFVPLAQLATIEIKSSEFVGDKSTSVLEIRIEVDLNKLDLMKQWVSGQPVEIQLEFVKFQEKLKNVQGILLYSTELRTSISVEFIDGVERMNIQFGE